MVGRRRALSALFLALGMGVAGSGCGVLTAQVEDEVTISFGEAVSVGYAEVESDWSLVVGGEPEDDLGEGQWQVMGDVVATNVGDEAREILLEFTYLSGGDEVLTAICVSEAEDVAPEETVDLGCAGPAQVTPADFDSIRVRALS